MVERAKALISVSDKRGIDRLARFLIDRGWDILSTGGTAQFLDKQGVPYTQVADYTGFPEMLDGRVKTLQPKIHGGILARRHNHAHQAACRAHGILPIDWVIVNLYPFAETIRKDNCPFDEAIENIDIGGPSLLRAAAKNFEDVVVLVDPDDYERIMDEFEKNKVVSRKTRLSLAQKVLRHSACYDALIADYLHTTLDPQAEGDLSLSLKRVQTLRYGENPHQAAALHVKRGDTLPWVQIQGKELSYNNILDFTAAYELIQEFKDETACVIVKHTNPCGVAVSESLREAFLRAKACDPTSAFGGIVAVSRTLDEETAQALSEMFLELVIAPAFTAGARERLESKSNLRLIHVTGPLPAHSRDYRRVLGGVLVQEEDTRLAPSDAWQWVSRRQASADERKALELAWRTAKYAKSNAIVFASPSATLGIGAGQMSRIDSVKIAGQKALTSLKGAAMASDAFFPFRDTVDEAARLGISAIVAPGGSIRDPEVIAAADEHDMAMAFTGERHFRH